MNTKTSTIKARLIGFFDKQPDKQRTIREITDHFNDIKLANLNYHLKTLIDTGFLVRPKQGIYRKNLSFKTAEEKRQLVEEHIKGNGRVQAGPPWKPGDPPLTLVENPVMVSFLGRSFGESILERMKSSGAFTSTELRFLTRLLNEKYPLTEQQRLTLERT